MKLLLNIEKGKDKEKKEKLVMWSTLTTEIEGLKRIDAVSEIPKDDPLAKAIDEIITSMLEQKQAQIKEENKKLLANKRK